MTVPYGAADARIASLSVTEGQRVERGAVLAVLDNERALLAAAASARATVAAREATLTQVESSVRASRGEATALLDGAHVAAKRASRELERRKALHAGGVVADDEFERYEAASEQAEHDVRRARAALSRYRAGDAGAQADALVARRNLEAARAEVVRAEAELERAYVRAPFAATVLTIEARPGERPGPEGILRLADLERMNLAIDVYETQVGRIAVGDHAEAKADALPRVLRGRVVKVGMLVGRQQTVDVNPAANTDARVIEVTVALDEQSSAVARSFTNLQVTARLCPGSAR
jgi:HlyD family secretion protein